METLSRRMIAIGITATAVSVAGHASAAPDRPSKVSETGRLCDLINRPDDASTAEADRVLCDIARRDLVR